MSSCFDHRPWNVPLTWILDVEGVEVRSVSSAESDTALPSIEGEKNTMEGWWQQSDGRVVLSVVNGHQVKIALNGSNVEHDVLAQADFFNNHSAAVTVAGHETTDLFKWSKRFVDDTDVRFTWLVQPRPSDGQDAWIPCSGRCWRVHHLPYAGRFGPGRPWPWSSLAGQETLHNEDQPPLKKRSLDADEEA